MSCSPATSGLMLALSMEQWELLRPSATEPENHLTCPLLSCFALTAILDPPSLMALCPSLLFAAAGPTQEASAHVSSYPSSWHGQSPSTSLRGSPWTRWSSTLARENSPQALHLLPAHVFISYKTCYSPHHSPSNGCLASQTVGVSKHFLGVVQEGLAKTSVDLAKGLPPYH